MSSRNVVLINISRSSFPVISLVAHIPENIKSSKISHRFILCDNIYSPLTQDEKEYQHPLGGSFSSIKASVSKFALLLVVLTEEVSSCLFKDLTLLLLVGLKWNQK